MLYVFLFYWDLEPKVDFNKPEKCEEAEVGGGVHGGDLVRDALLLSVVHLAIIIVVIIFIIVVYSFFHFPSSWSGGGGDDFDRGAKSASYRDFGWRLWSKFLKID